jgi:hypothetical protein
MTSYMEVSLFAELYRAIPGHEIAVNKSLGHEK